MSTRSRGSSDSDSPPDDLPDVDYKTRRYQDVEEPEDLPDLPSSSGPRKVRAIDAARTCPYCGSTEVRIAAGSNGVRAYCTPCKRHWGVSMAPMAPTIPLTRGRGIHKETLVQPDWSLVDENLDDDKFRRSGDD